MEGNRGTGTHERRGRRTRSRGRVPGDPALRGGRVLLLAVAFLAPAEIGAQPPGEILREGEPPTLVLREVQVLEDQVGSSPWSVLEFTDGRLVVAYAAEPRLQLFDAEGRHLSFWGGGGEGPGEFGRVGGMALGSIEGEPVLWVLDTALQRVVAFDLDGGHRETRRIDVPPPGRIQPGTLAALGDTVVVNVNGESPGLEGHWLLAFPPTGPPVPVGGREDPVDPELRGYYRYRSLAVSGEDLLVAHRVRYRIDRVDRATLVARDAVEGVRDFFPAFDRDRYRAEVRDDPEGGFFLEDGPRPFLYAIEACGPAWFVALHVRDDEDWEAGRETFDLNRVFDTVIERLDAGRSRVTGTARVDGAVGGFTNRGRPWRYAEDDVGIPRIHLYALDPPGDC